MDAWHSDHYLYAYAEHIDKLDQLDVNTWMDDYADEMEVEALDMALNVLVLPSFVVDQHYNLALGRVMISMP